jgi:hypothetical protein
MNQPAQPTDMRATMPNTAAFVDRKRAEYGAEHVNDCLRKAMAGEPGHFFAMERGHVVGTPFPLEHAIAEWQSVAIVASLPFAAFIREPKNTGGDDGAH